MSDQDFNFNSPPRREAKKTFEPPPWEKEQFEELARRKEAERIAAAALARASVPTTAGQPEVGQQPAGAPVPPATVAEPVQPAAQQVVAQQQVASKATEHAAPVEDPRIEAMLLGLRNEEPTFGEDVWRISVGAGSVLAAIGLIFVVWGIVALIKTRGAGFAASFGGVILTSFGLAFAGIGAWMVFKALREQGVL